MVVVAGLKRQRRVSWARDDNLCKVRLFLSEDAPSQSGFGAQDHLQAKAAWLLHTSGVVDSDDSLPPGFEKLHKLQPKLEISQIPIIKWQCPPRLAVNPEWLVVAGEESQEVGRENQRHLGVLEAVYPRPSSIPPNPAVALEAQDATANDSQTPLIPITGIEEEEEDSTEESDAVVSASNCAPPLQSRRQHTEGSQIPNLPRVGTQPPSMAATMVTAMAGMAPGAEPDFVAAASAAFTAIMRSSEEGSLVDRDLLIKILSNPGMIGRLASEYGGGPKQSAQLKQNPQALAAPPPPPPAACRTRTGAVSPLSAPVPHSFRLPNMATRHPPGQMPTVPPVNPPVVKDANYYKSLIQLHGGEKPLQVKNAGHRSGTSGSLEHDCYRNNMMMKSKKVLKPCAYFNTPRGCRHGAGCLFQHDGYVHRAFEQQKGTSKRIKLDRGIGGSS